MTPTHPVNTTPWRRFDKHSVQLLAAWTLVIAGATSSAYAVNKPRCGATPSAQSAPTSATSGPTARAPRR